MHYSSVPLPEGFPEGNPCSTLYITNIDPKVKEKNLASFFEHYGPIQTVKIVREKASGKSLSYGFVEFINPSHAELARTKAQYQRIERREILVMFTSERQKLLQEAKVFVKNIPPSVTVNELHNHFAQTSPQLFVHINTDDKGKRLNFGFVHYLNIEDAEIAFEKLQDTELRGQKLQLSRWVVKEARQIAQNETRRNLYIRNLPLLKKKVIESSLRQILSVHGEIESMLIKKVPKLNSYYALVSFKDPQAAQTALKELSANPASLEGSTEPLYVSWYQRKNERKVQSGQQMNALYMSSLKPDVTEQAVKDIFEQYGKVIKVILTSWQEVDNNVDVKCGYAVFEDENSAEDAFARFPLNVSLKKLFISDPEIELTSYRLSLGNQNKTKTHRRREQSPQYSAISEEPCMYWPMPVPYMGNFFQGVYPPYFPMGYYPAPMANPAGFAPVYPNPMFMMPQESMMDQNSYLYLPNDPYYEQEYECKPGRKTSMMSTIIAEQETRPNSLGSLSSLDGDQHDESTNTEGHTSSEESDSLELDNKKMSRQESDKSETKTQGNSLNKTSCKPKRKYGNFCVQRRPILP